MLTRSSHSPPADPVAEKPRANNSADRLRRVYRLAFALIACLVLLSQFVVQRAIKRQATDAPVLKLAGQQETLAQKLCKDSLELSVATLPEKITEKLAQIRIGLEALQRVHAGLQHGDTGLELPGQNSPRITALFASIDPSFQAMTQATEKVLDAIRNVPMTKPERFRVSWNTTKLATNSETFARGMQQIVAAYEMEAKARITAMQRLELALMSITLVALLVEAVLVFKPATQTIRRQMGDLEQQAVDLRKARQAAEVASRAKTCFLTNMSHEIRTPMSAITGYADQLRDPHLPASERARYADKINTSGHHLLALINNILELASSETAQLVAHPVQCSARQIVFDVVSELSPRAKEKGLKLSVACRGNLPVSIQTDPARLKAILTQLIDNAIKFTDEGHVTIAVSLPDPAVERLRFEVSDTGRGISHEHQRRLFLAFTQSDESLTRRDGGLGIGLILAKRMAEALGGDMAVDSEPNHGSTFIVEIATGSLRGIDLLPEFGQETPDAGIASPPAPADIARGRRLLIVDDAPDIQRLLQFVLIKAGAIVTLAGNGQEGIDKILDASRQGQPFDLVFMDMQMPVLDGYQATQRLRELGQQLPVIAVTAHAMSDDQEKCLAAGCTDFCTKPIDRTKLLELIQRHLRRTSVAA